MAAVIPRLPDSTTSQKQFTIGFVLLTRAGDDATSAAAAIETLRKAFAGKFAELTQAKGNIPNVPASLEIAINSPAIGAAVTGPDVTIQGTIINTSGAETGVTVNGVVATVNGNRFIANHVPITEGSNTITVTATDANGLIATTSRTINAQAGNYIRIRSNIESGTAPLEVSLRIEGSFNVTNPQITTSGTATTEWLPAISQTELAAKITSEGTLAVTASAVGPDGQQYSDTVTITVVSRTQLENLLKGKWEGIKTKTAAMDVEGALSFLPTSSQADYRDIFTSLGSRLPVLSQDLPSIKLKSVTNSRAKCLLLRQETVLGQQKTVGYPVNFIKENGIWKLREF